jgi:single-stranded-DNA-specific exonuclease
VATASKKKRWQYRGSDSGQQTDEKLSPELLAACDGSLVLARLLYNRGIQSAADAKTFLDLPEYQPTSGLELPDMAIGIQRMVQAIEKQEPVLIYGDFDVDGITGTSLLYECLKTLGAKVSYYIPDRALEGHGLNTTALCRLVSSRALKLVITTDTGITNFNEVSLLNGLGVDTIVTDHHELPENLPPAVANINPQRFEDKSHPLALLAGVGVAYKFCELLIQAFSPQHLSAEEAASLTEQLLDLVAIGTVADLASLHRDNRYLVYRGLQVLQQRKRLGVRQILENAGTKPEAELTSETVGFTIGPRLNAIGRLSNATEAVELLTTSDVERVNTLAAHLEHLNRRRQELCESTYLEAQQYFSASGGIGQRKAIIIGSPDWNLGVIGIVASRLIEAYHVPVFMMMIDESQQIARCSARSIPGFHMHEALTHVADMLTVFGGHSGAGGCTLPLAKLPAFKEAMYQYADKVLTEDMTRPIVHVDDRLAWSQVNLYLVDVLDKLAPFGQDNPSPRFVLENMAIAAQRAIGADGKHRKLILRPFREPNAKTIDALLWNAGSQSFDGKVPHDFVVSLSRNTFNNTTTVQAIVEDIRETVSASTSNSASASASASNGQAGNGSGNIVYFAAKPASNVISMNNASLSKIQDTSTTEEAVSEAEMTVQTEAQPETQEARWVDHRNRDAVERFLYQLMLPAESGRTIRVFHEGRPPNIPFLNPELLCTRYTITEAEELIFWDIPPDAAMLHQIIALAGPEVVHWVGGKYQSMPTVPVAKDMLKIIFQSIQAVQKEQSLNALLTNNNPVETRPPGVKQATLFAVADVLDPSTVPDDPFVTLALESFSARLATTTTVVLNGLLALNKLKLLEITSPDKDSKDSLETLLYVKPFMGRAQAGSVPLNPLEMLTLQQALDAVGSFRQWALTSPIAHIKAVVSSQGYQTEFTQPALSQSTLAQPTLA